MRSFHPIPGNWFPPTANIAAPAVVAVQPPPPAPTPAPHAEGEEEMDWLLKIINLLPVIAAGIQIVHTDKDVATKTQFAQDALAIAIAGASAVAPTENQAEITKFGGVASTTLASFVDAFHNANPAPVVVPALG